MHRGFALDPVECPVDGLDGVLLGDFGPRLHVGLVQLHHVGAGGEQIADFLVHRSGVIHGRGFVGVVVIVLRLLRHGEGAGQGKS